MMLQRQSKKGKRKDTRSARLRYWASRTLESRKVRNILKNKQKNKDGSLMTVDQARRWWVSRRQGRVPEKFIPIFIKR